MAAYRVVCVEWQTFDDGHRHIVAIGTGDNPRKAEERWTMTEVLFSMRFGQDRFYTEDADGRSAGVDRVYLRLRRSHPRIGGRRGQLPRRSRRFGRVAFASVRGRVRSLSVDDLGLVVAVEPQITTRGWRPFRCMRYSSRKKGMPKTQNA